MNDIIFVNMKRCFLFIQLVFATMMAMSQSLSVNVPSHVQNGENFRLSYTVNTQNVGSFHVGNIPDGLEIITGPYTSSQSSFKMVNGHTSSSSSVTYTFILCATKNGSYTIPPATVEVDGKTVSSNSAKVTVSGTSSNANGAPHMHEDNANEDNHNQVKPAGSPISGSDLFIRVNANKKRVHEQEPILLTYKVYTLVELTQLEGKMPDLTGFHTQEIPLPQQKSFHVENVNGRNYRTVTWSQYVMYPQMTGKLEIPGIAFNGTIVQQNRNIDPFEAFLNGGSGYVEVKRKIEAPGLTIQVDPLPARPVNFSGGVGKFNISAQLLGSGVRANEPITIRVVVGGIGNLKLIKQPIVEFPKDFDKYDAKITDKTKLTSNGVEGNIIYDFLAVPRNQGKYTIPPVDFVYYDTEANSYKTIKTQSFDINVAEGDGTSGSSVDFMETKDGDIHGIKTSKTKGQNGEQLFFGSSLYWTLLASLLALFVVLLIAFRRRAIENADVVKMKGKRANKVATRRLRTSKKLMDQGKQGEFYDEVLRALWGYVGDKLNIPVTELTHDNISGKLSEHQVDEKTISDFINALDECEYERYAPGDAAGNMNKTYEYAITAIMRIEEVMKRVSKKKNSGHSRAMLLLCLVLILPFVFVGSVHAVSKKEADEAFSKGNYQQAASIYEELLKQGKNADLFYNLGNSYYRMDNMTKAILNYERAALLNPSDEDIQFNLALAKGKTIDKIVPRSEMFFFVWYRSLVNMLSVDSWAWVALVSILLASLLTLLYLFSDQIALRKCGFFGGIFFLVLFILGNICAYQQKQTLQNSSGAIVTATSVTLKKTPDKKSSDQAVIHEGTRVNIIDDTMKDWKAVQLEDGREGWVSTSQIERI